MKKQDYIILSIILLIALVLRLYNINTPLADLNSWQQVDTAAIGRTFVKDGFNLFQPGSNDNSVEFPLYSAIFAFFYKYIPLTSLEIYARLTTGIFSLFIIAIIYYLGLKEHSRAAGIFAAIVYAILPFFVFFSRVVLPETTGLAFMFISIWLLYLYFHTTKKNILLFIVSIVMYALSLLIKPTTFFYTIAIGYLFIMHYKFDVFKKWQLYIFVVLGILPFIAWRMYIQQLPPGVPTGEWLIGSIPVDQGMQNVFFTPAYFTTMIMERFGVLIFGMYLSGFFILGLIAKVKKYLIFSIGISALVYLLTFQGANMQYAYYQTIILPALALITGLGIAQVINTPSTVNPVLAYPIIILTIGLAFSCSFYKVKHFYNHSQDVVQIAKLINTLTKEDDLVVTDTNGDTTILYLADRKGAPAAYKDVTELKKMGYDYFVTDKKTLSEQLKTEGYTVLVDNDKISIIKL